MQLSRSRRSAHPGTAVTPPGGEPGAAADAPGPDAELALMRRVASNDNAAMAELYRRWHYWILQQMRDNLPCTDDPAGQAQQVMIALWRSAGKFDPSRSSLNTWVRLLTNRHLVDRIRRVRVRRARSRERQITDADDGCFPAHEGEPPKELPPVVARSLARLKPSQREVLMLFYGHGLTIPATARALGLPEGTVKSALSRALVRLRREGRRAFV